MLDKQRIEGLKTGNLDELHAFFRDSRDNRQILLVLESLGHLPSGFDGDVLLPLLQSTNKDIRFWALKNLGKLKNKNFLHAFYGVAQSDRDSMVRREAVSSIGRIRDRSTISYLEQLLNDVDPKVVLQAIRGLLVFKYNPLVQERLKQLYSHPNEIIQGVISKELSLNGYSHQAHYLHPQSPDFMKNVVVNSDVREALRLVPDESIHLTFTSPPYYNARDYSIYESYNAYLDFLTEVFAELHRVTKEGRFFVLNTSPVIIPRVSRSHSSRRYPIPFDIHPRLTEIGWEFIDDIVWAKPEASVKNRNAGFLQHRKPLGYKPNPVTEYLMVYRKKTDKLLDWNMRQYDEEIINKSRVQGNYTTSNLWEIDPTFDKVHSAVFPIELCHRVIRFYSYVGDLVFDPFGGSGTMGRAAQNLERFFFMTEQEEKYFERMKKDLLNKTLFGENVTRFLTLSEFQAAAESQGNNGDIE
jgi:DNA modification methylase